MEWTRRERQALEAELRGRLRGQVRFSDPERALYASDASIYQVMPLGAVVPADAADAAEAVRLCLDAGAPVLPRGGGTSLAGQAVGEAVVLDLSRNLDEILTIDPEARTAVVEPGVVQSHLNRAAGRHGLMFGPDTASATRATLGGMLGNNSSGAHSILYGKTVDHVRRVEAVLSDGAVHALGPVSLGGPAPADGVLGRVCRLARRLRRHQAAEIRARYPKVMRRVSGYNLDALLPREGCDHQEEVNLASLLVGSEGSLGTVLSMEVDLVPAPATRGVALLHFADLEPAIAATTRVLEQGPSAVELMDAMLLDLAAAHPGFRPRLWFMTPATRAVLLVEFFADADTQLARKLATLEALARDLPGCVGATVARTALQVNDAWAVRKAGLPLLASIPTRRKPLPFVEDTAVDPERLPEFVRRFKEVVTDHQTRAAYYAHASAGCLHIRPLLDLHDEGDRARLESLSEAIFELVVEFGGSMSGEHGDGRARSHYNARLFGPRVYRAFQELKAAFDPRNLFNPGQVVDAPPMGEDLRWDFHRTPELPRAGFHWEHEGGFPAAVEACNGTGACRQRGEGGTMCPSFMATRDEQHSTRGRANLLRAALTGALPPAQLHGEAMEQALELCLSCKACKHECPVKVDMARLKAEWQYGRNQSRGMGPTRWMLARTRTWLDLAGRSPRLANRLLDGLAVPLGRLLGGAGAPPLPRLAPVGLRERLRDRPPPLPGPRTPVVLFADCFSRHLAPEPFLDAVWLLERAGNQVLVPELACCGRPALGQGDLDEVRRLAEQSLAALRPHLEAGTPILGLEPGCLSMFWDDYPALLRGPEVRRLAAQVHLVDEHLLARLDAGVALGLGPLRTTLGLHPHCHQLALGRAAATRTLLARVPGLEVHELRGGCCGMAGDFGYRHPEVSAAVWRQTDASRWDGATCMPGWSCRQQARGHGRAALAPVQVLRGSVEGGGLAV